MRLFRTALTTDLPGAKAHTTQMPHPRSAGTDESAHKEKPESGAVLLAVVPDGNKLSIPFIKRPEDARHHPGQISFPGGKMEKADASLLETALREAYEETGIRPEEISIIGQLTKVYVPASNFNIYPILGTALSRPEFSPSTHEVAELLLVPMQELFDDANKETRIIRKYNTEIEAPGYKIGPHFIWGATAMIISELEYIVKHNIKNLFL